jgi:hypothetical protein
MINQYKGGVLLFQRLRIWRRCRLKCVYISGYNLHKKVRQTFEPLLPGNSLYAVLGLVVFYYHCQLFAKADNNIARLYKLALTYF